MKAVSLLLTILTAYGTVVVNSDLSVNNKHTSKKKKKPTKSLLKYSSSRPRKSSNSTY